MKRCYCLMQNWVFVRFHSWCLREVKIWPWRFFQLEHLISFRIEEKQEVQLGQLRSYHLLKQVKKVSRATQILFRMKSSCICFSWNLSSRDRCWWRAQNWWMGLSKRSLPFFSSIPLVNCSSLSRVSIDLSRPHQRDLAYYYLLQSTKASRYFD